MDGDGHAVLLRLLVEEGSVLVALELPVLLVSQAGVVAPEVVPAERFDAGLPERLDDLLVVLRGDLERLVDGLRVAEHVHEELLGARGLGQCQERPLDEGGGDHLVLELLGYQLGPLDEDPGPALGDVRDLELLVVLHGVDDVPVDERGVLLVHPDMGAQVAGHDGQVHQPDSEVHVEVLLSLEERLGELLRVVAPLAVLHMPVADEPPADPARDRVGGEAIGLLSREGRERPLLGLHLLDGGHLRHAP